LGVTKTIDKLTNWTEGICLPDLPARYTLKISSSEKQPSLDLRINYKQMQTGEVANGFFSCYALLVVKW